MDDYDAVLKAVELGQQKAKTQLAWYKLRGHAGAKIDFDEAVVLLEERVKDKDGKLESYGLLSQGA